MHNMLTSARAWTAFVRDKKARDSAEAQWITLHDKLVEAERLLFEERWATDDPWPGVLYRGPTGYGLKVVDVETWTLMRALLRGMGEALIRQRPSRQ